MHSCNRTRAKELGKKKKRESFLASLNNIPPLIKSSTIRGHPRSDPQEEACEVIWFETIDRLPST
jgi:hypothetical protein